jgi:NADPH:quinone reductase-like Zn-dependent oxidoreductase
MRAYAANRFGDIGELQLKELPKPVPAADQILVEVKAAAVNPADLKVLAHRDGGSFLHASAFPLMLGYDYSGVVVEVGAEASPHQVGDEVYGFLPYARRNRAGSFAEFVAVGAGTAAKKPTNLTHAEAAAAATSVATAYQALRDKARLAAGQHVLINGASGGVGSYAVQLAKAMGAEVSATASASKLEHVTRLGATTVYDYKATPLAQLAAKFDVVLDVAATSGYGTCARLLNKGGTYVTLLPSAGVFLGMARALFSSKRCRFVIVQSIAADFTDIAGYFEAGKLVSAVDSTYPFAELPAALARMQSGEARGKIAITINR